jgi:hypothetical protein
MAIFTTGQAGGQVIQPTSVPAAYTTDAQDLARSQRLAQMLTATPMPEGQMISGRYVAPSITQNLAQFANMATGAYFADKAEKQNQALAEKLRTGETQALADFMKTKQGTPAEMFAAQAGPMPDGGNIPVQQSRAAVAPNPQAAFANLYQDPRSPQRLRDLAFTKMMADPEAFTLSKGAIRYERQPDGTTKQVAAGAPDLPDSIQYAIAVGQLPANPASWNKQQADYAKSLVESKTSAGASKYDFSNMLGKSVSDVAPILIASKTATGGAIQQADAANRIIQSLDTNKIFTGAGANQKLQAAQIGQMLGVTGGKTEEIVANTRTAIQGLAQLTLQGRKQMRGEGAITESEGALAQRAMSGDVSLTAGELRILANAAKRSAKFTYDQHQSMMGALAKDSPNSVPYYQIEVNPNIFATSSSDVRTKADEIINKPNKP